MTSTLLILVFFADPLLGDAGIATAKSSADSIELTLAHGHDGKAVADAIHDKIPAAQVSGDGPVLTVKGATLAQLQSVEVNEPGPGNMLAMEAPTAGGSIRVARAMDMPQDDMVRAKVVALGKGDTPILKLKRTIKSKDKKAKSTFSAALIAKSNNPSDRPLKVGDEVLVHLTTRKTAAGQDETVIDQIRDGLP